jgi:putative hydrolase of the HAD superfamily
LRLHEVEAQASAMFEDMPHNLEAPHTLGMTTVLVRSDYDHDHPVHKAIRSWREPPEHVHHMTDDLAAFLASAAPPSRE